MARRVIAFVPRVTIQTSCTLASLCYDVVKVTCHAQALNLRFLSDLPRPEAVQHLCVATRHPMKSQEASVLKHFTNVARLEFRNGYLLQVCYGRRRVDFLEEMPIVWADMSWCMGLNLAADSLFSCTHLVARCSDLTSRCLSGDSLNSLRFLDASRSVLDLKLDLRRMSLEELNIAHTKVEELFVPSTLRALTLDGCFDLSSASRERLQLCPLTRLTIKHAVDYTSWMPTSLLQLDMCISSELDAVCRRLTRLTSLSVRPIRDPRFLPEAYLWTVQRLSRLTALTRLHWGDAVEAMVPRFSALTPLRMLSMSLSADTVLSATTLISLSHLTALESLHVAGAVEDAEIPELENMTSLTSLTFESDIEESDSDDDYNVL